MKKINKTPFAAVMGVAVISTFAAGLANAETSPFGMTELSQGYMQVAEADKTPEMACGEHMSMPQDPSAAKPADAKAAEMKCGGMMDGDKMKKGMEGACGEMMKGKEGACGMMAAGESMKGKEGACGAGMKMPEGKCGDQCGDNMKLCEAAKTKEGACGAMMKGCDEGMKGCADMMHSGDKTKEGACGAGMKMPAHSEHKESHKTDKTVGTKVIPFVPAAK